MIKNEYMSKYRQEHKEQYLEYQKNYREKNKKYWKEYRQNKIGNYVYALLDAYDEIIYIGSTTDLYNRISMHKNNKEFDRAVYVDYPELTRNDTYFIEQRLIEMYTPDSNKRNAYKNSVYIVDKQMLDELAQEFFYLANDYKFK